MKNWSVVAPDGTVVTGFDATEEFVENLQPEPWWPEGSEIVDVTDQPERPVLGWKLDKDKGWAKPVRVDVQPTAEELEEIRLSQEEDAFIAASLSKVRKGGKLTQDERDRLMLLQLSRGT